MFAPADLGLDTAPCSGAVSRPLLARGDIFQRANAPILAQSESQKTALSIHEMTSWGVNGIAFERARR